MVKRGTYRGYENWPQSGINFRMAWVVSELGYDVGFHALLVQSGRPATDPARSSGSPSRSPRVAIHRFSGDSGLEWIAELGMLPVGAAMLKLFYDTTCANP